MTLRLKKKIFITGGVETLTGLHIGGGDSGMDSGGLDKGAVIRTSVTNQPYIPGSSLKGKMRALLEKLRGEYQVMPKGGAGPGKAPDYLAAKIFGLPAEVDFSDSPEINASRLVVRDAFLSPASVERLGRADLDLPFTETKTETAIDRITSKAVPRTFERVPAGAEFDFQMTLTIYEGDNEKELLDGLLTALLLVQEDYLGGRGSRGSGRIKFKHTTLMVKSNEDYINGNDAQVYAAAGFPLLKELI